MKKIICIAMATGLILTSAFSKVKTKFNVDGAVKDTGSVTMKDISATEVTKLMGTGWNLGNTLDATNGRSLNSETSWGQPKTTKQMIDGLVKSGIKTIRIPVSWSNHISDSSYTIDPAWMARVKEIVDWAISDGMYVILNCHHDNYKSETGLTAGKGYYPNEKNYDNSEQFITNVWAQVAMAFNNGYDEHLIFETMNEPRLAGTASEWVFKASDSKCDESAKVINKLNQVALDVIRGTGGNNAKRFVMVPGYVASPDSVLSNAFQLPQDSAEQKLIVSVHMYTPYIFAGQSPGTANFTPTIQNQFTTVFKKLNTKFVSNGVGVVIGEYGAVNKNNTDQRVNWFSAYIKYSQMQNIPAVLWDNGNWEVKEGSKDYNEKFGFYNRNTQTWYFPEILDAIIKEVQN